jgi:RND family efflux transporter MFP subunit
MTSYDARIVRFAPACMVLGLLITSPGCNQNNGTGAAPAPAATAQTPSVAVVHPQRKALHRVVEQPAFVEAFEQTPLYAAIPGYVHKVYVDSGDRVKGPRFDQQGKEMEPGQILAELWVPQREEELKQKKALVAQAAAEVDQAIAAHDAADANVTSAKALVTEAKAGRERAQALYDRWKTQHDYEEGLVKQKLFDQQNFEITVNQFRSADAARKEVEAKVGSSEALAKESAAKRNKAKADIAAARARVEVAKAEEGSAAALLEYSKIRAPYEGVITIRDVHTGHYLTGAATKPLFVIVRTDKMRIIVDVPEADALAITDGTPARVRCQVIKDHDYEGIVKRSSWSLDPKARTLRAQIDVKGDGHLRPGMYTYVSFNTESASTFTLPAAAVVIQGDQAFCFQAENGKAVWTPIKIGARNGQLVQVLKKQAPSPANAKAFAWQEFTGKEQIVASGVASLTDGQAITVEQRPKK